MPKSRFITATLAAIVAVGGAAGQAASQEPGGRQARYSGHFMRIYDTSGDKKVRLKEISGEQKRLFGAVDLNGDGALSVDEFRRRGRMLQTMSTTTIFDLLDTNGDRKISAAELAAPSKRWFSRYDANGDGALKADELPQHGRRGRGGPRRGQRR